MLTVYLFDNDPDTANYLRDLLKLTKIPLSILARSEEIFSQTEAFVGCLLELEWEESSFEPFDHRLKFINLIDLDAGKITKEVAVPNDVVFRLRKVSSNTQHLLGYEGKTLCVWDLNTDQKKPINSKYPTYMSLSPDGRVITRWTTSTAREFFYDSVFWDVLNNRELFRIYNFGPSKFSPDGKTVAGFGEGGIHLLDYPTPWRSPRDKSTFGHRLPRRSVTDS